MPRKVFVAGEILTAADVNTNLMDQAVMVFDDATARTTAIPTPVEGMVTYLSDVNQVQAFTGSAFTSVGGILQVVSTTKTDTFTSASSTLTDITGLSVSITPSSTLSKILVLSAVHGSQDVGSNRAFLRLMRDSTPIFVGDSADSREPLSGSLGSPAAQILSGTSSSSFLDSPNTTSSVTYKWQGVAFTGGSFFINRTEADADQIAQGRFASTITVMEVAG